MHIVVVAMAVIAVVSAARFPSGSSAAIAPSAPPQFLFSGLSNYAPTETVLRPGTGQLTRPSVAALTSASDPSLVRTSAGIDPNTSISTAVSVQAGVTAAGTGTFALADLIDPQQPYVLHTTGEGDTLSKIAARYGISVETILDNNHELSDANLLRFGQQIIVPRGEGILHKVALGETVSSIVNQYDNITVSTVLSYRPNGLQEGSTLEAGTFVLLPGATHKPPPPPPPPPSPSPSGGGGTVIGNPPPNSGGRFSMPLAAYRGVSDRFGTPRGAGRIHTGIDLDLWGYWNSPIYSACAGTVSRVEYLTYSYGYHVIVNCGDGWSTLYAHMSEIHVYVGQSVSAGTVLGISGLTGFTTGEHLHFEIRYNNAPVNPADYLPF